MNNADTGSLGLGFGFVACNYVLFIVITIEGPCDVYIFSFRIVISRYFDTHRST